MKVLGVHCSESTEDGKQVHKRRRGLLRMYYGVDSEAPKEKENPLDLDKAGFQLEAFMEKSLKERSLNELFNQEQKMKKGIVLCYIYLTGS